MTVSTADTKIETTTIKITEVNEDGDAVTIAAAPVSPTVVTVTAGTAPSTVAKVVATADVTMEAVETPFKKPSPPKKVTAGKGASSSGTTDQFRALLAKHKKMRKLGWPEQLPCEVCGRRFVDEPSLRAHEATHLGEARRYACDVCGVRFSHQSSLQPHRRRHTGERPFQCDVCGLAFTTSGSMGRHKRLRHPESVPSPSSPRKRGRPSLREFEYPFACEICEARFKNRDAYMSHAGTHLGDAPFHCTFCGLCFTKKGSLYRHMRIKHPVEGKEMLESYMRDAPSEGSTSASKEEPSTSEGNTSASVAKVKPSTIVTTVSVDDPPATELDKGENDIVSCGFCGMCFTTKGSMYRHMRKKHPFGDEDPDTIETAESFMNILNP